LYTLLKVLKQRVQVLRAHRRFRQNLR